MHELDVNAIIYQILHSCRLYTVWHENLTVIKFYGLPKLLKEKKLTDFNFTEVHVMRLSLSCPTHPRSGNGWGFVGDLSPRIVPRVGAFAQPL